MSTINLFPKIPRTFQITKKSIFGDEKFKHRKVIKIWIIFIQKERKVKNLKSTKNPSNSADKFVYLPNSHVSPIKWNYDFFSVQKSVKFEFEFFDENMSYF